MKIYGVYAMVAVTFILSILLLIYASMDKDVDKYILDENQEEAASAVRRKIEENLQLYGQIKKNNVSLEGCTIVISKIYDRSCLRNNPLDNIIGTKNIINLSEITNNRREISVDQDPERIESAFIYWKLNRKNFEKEDVIDEKFFNLLDEYRNTDLNDIDKSNKITDVMERVRRDVGLDTRSYIQKCDAGIVYGPSSLRSIDAYKSESVDEIVDLVLSYKSRFCKAR